MRRHAASAISWRQLEARNAAMTKLENSKENAEIEAGIGEPDSA